MIVKKKIKKASRYFSIFTQLNFLNHKFLECNFEYLFYYNPLYLLILLISVFSEECDFCIKNQAASFNKVTFFKK